MNALALAALAIGLAIFTQKKAPDAAKVRVEIGPAKIKAIPSPTKAAKKPGKVKVTIGPAKIKPVRASVPTSVHDTTAVAVNAARPASGAPIPNPEAARKVAQSVADHYRANRKKYDHGRVSTFQAFAGLKPDGIYGPKTAQALRHYGALKVVG